MREGYCRLALQARDMFISRMVFWSSEPLARCLQSSPYRLIEELRRAQTHMRGLVVYNWEKNVMKGTHWKRIATFQPLPSRSNDTS